MTGLVSRLPWPLPALLTWGAAWGVFALLDRSGADAWVALLPSCGLAVAGSLLGRTWWRRAIIAGGFPVSLLIFGAAVLPSSGWLGLLVVLALIYPLNAWRDAPFFPTPTNALQALAHELPLPAGALVLDAGCGLGHGLNALRAAYPHVQLHGIEWSWPLYAWCAMRCPWARVQRGDLWRADWGPYALVYLFQRPESMARAIAKAGVEMRPGSWLVSLEFEASQLIASAVLSAPDGRPVWIYRIPFQPAPLCEDGSDEKPGTKYHGGVPTPS